MELTVQDVAKRLNIPAQTLLRWIRQGKIPMQFNRGDYSIRPEMLERWASDHKLKIHSARQQAPTEDGDAALSGISPAMRRGGIFYNVPGDDRETVLRAAVDRIPNLEPDDRPMIYDKLIEREHLASTGIGHGIALPHPRSTPGVVLAHPRITTCFLRQPVDFEAIDHRPVSLLMIVLSCSTKQHLSLLSRLAFYLRDAAFRDYVIGVPENTALLDKITALDAGGY